MKNLYIIVISALLTSVLTSVFILTQFDLQQEQVKPLPRDTHIQLTGALRSHFQSSSPTDFIDAAQNNMSNVVGINTLESDGEQGGDTERFAQSGGSGVIISSDGYIVTNNHVVKNAYDIEIVLNDNREFQAKIIGQDSQTDLAVLKIEATDLEPAVIGNSDSLRVGEWVLAIGNPFKLRSTVTAGIVSAKARDINILERQGIESFIQTDAAVNPGNSGGALVNTNGELVGINTAILSFSGQYEGFSFAIPSNLMQKITYDIIQYGAVQRGWVGIGIVDVDNARAENLNLDFVGGVYVNYLKKDGAGQLAGIEVGDVITSVNNTITQNTAAFTELIGRYRPGDSVTIDYFRNGIKNTVNIILRNQLNTTDFIAIRKDKILVDLGFELRDLDENEETRVNKDGVYVVSVYRGSIIDNTEMEPGFIVTHVNKNRVKTVQELVDLLETENGQVFLEGFYENYPGQFLYSFEVSN